MAVYQSHLPVIVSESRAVVGSIPLAGPLELSGTDQFFNIGGYDVPLEWMKLRRTSERSTERMMAYVPIDLSDLRQSKFPVYFQRNPEFYFPLFHAERDVLHWRSPAIPDFWRWVFIHGATATPKASSPAAEVEEEEVSMWTMEVPMVSSEECAFVDVDWTQFAPEGVTPVGIEISTLSPFPAFIRHSLVSEDMTQSMLGLTQAESTPIIRMYRVDTPVAGTYPVPMSIIHSGGTHSFVLDLIVN